MAVGLCWNCGYRLSTWVLVAESSSVLLLKELSSMGLCRFCVVDRWWLWVCGDSGGCGFLCDGGGFVGLSDFLLVVVGC